MRRIFLLLYLALAATADPVPRPRRYMTLARYARHRGRSARTIRNYVGQGFIPVIRFPGEPGVVVDPDEADAALAKIPSARIRPTYGRFGPDAVIRDLRDAVLGDDVVIER